jgi:hypothetical protein
MLRPVTTGEDYIATNHYKWNTTSLLSHRPAAASNNGKVPFPVGPRTAPVSQLQAPLEQQLTTTEQQQFFNSLTHQPPKELALLATSRHGPSRKHRSPVATQL